jgi:thiol-disulfide isomerase/thioredoxin
MGQKILTAVVVTLLGALLYITLFSEGLGKAPTITVTTLSGERIALEKPGKPILVNFWATTCPGCIAEMPHLAKMKKRLGDRFELVAVAMAYDPLNQVKNYIKAHGYPFKFVHDSNGKIAEAFGGVNLTPTSFLIAPNGNIVYRKVGEVDYDLVEARIKQMSPQTR